MRVPNAQKFEKERLSSVTITPWQLHNPKDPEVVFKEPVEKRADVEPETLVRRVYLYPTISSEFGYTVGCPNCDHVTRYGTACKTNHSEKCRNRMLEKLMTTEKGKLRIARATARLDRATWKASNPVGPRLGAPGCCPGGGEW